MIQKITDKYLKKRKKVNINSRYELDSRFMKELYRLSSLDLIELDCIREDTIKPPTFEKYNNLGYIVIKNIIDDNGTKVAFIRETME